MKMYQTKNTPKRKSTQAMKLIYTHYVQKVQQKALQRSESKRLQTKAKLKHKTLTRKISNTKSLY